MKAPKELIFNIHDLGDRDCKNINHKSRSEKIDNKICNEWYKLKGKINIIIGEKFENLLDTTKRCFS